MEATPSEGLQVTIQAKAFHTRLLNLVREYGSIKAAAAIIGISAACLSGWLKFQASPIRPKCGGGVRWQSNYIRDVVVPKLCELCRCHVSDLFPDWIPSLVTAKTELEFDTTVREQSLEDLSAEPIAMLESPDAAIIRDELKSRIEGVLKTLTHKERTAITLRYGIDGDGDRSLEEVSKIMGCVPERIRQIQEKALRKLRHPVRMKRVEDYAELGRPKSVKVSEHPLCPRGRHQMVGDNIKLNNRGQIYCRECRRESTRKSQASRAVQDQFDPSNNANGDPLPAHQIPSVIDV